MPYGNEELYELTFLCITNFSMTLSLPENTVAGNLKMYHFQILSLINKDIQEWTPKETPRQFY